MSNELGPPEIKVQDPGTREDTTFKSSKDGLTLYMNRFLPSTSKEKPPIAHLIFSHGFIEHTGRYFNIFPLFAQSNISLTCYDLRGFGLSWTKNENPRKAHGNTTWKQQFQDLEDLIKLERNRLDEQYGNKKVPIYIMGHSMGGGITFAFMTRPESEISNQTKDLVDGVICSSPWFKLTNRPPGLLFWLAPRLIKLYYDFPWYATVSPKEISHDLKVQQWTEKDPLVDGHVYLRSIVGPLLGGEELIEKTHKNYPNSKPLLIVHGSDDPVTSCKASKLLVERTKANEKEHKEFPNCLHEVWHEKGDVKIEFVQYIIDWVKSKSSSKL